ncbi:MAG: hypothetical protein ACE14L_01740 [Terriglobales bacterium]
MPRQSGTLRTAGHNPRYYVWLVTVLAIIALALAGEAAWFFTTADGPGYPIWMIAIATMVGIGLIAIIFAAFVND